MKNPYKTLNWGLLAGEKVAPIYLPIDLDLWYTSKFLPALKEWIRLYNENAYGQPLEAPAGLNWKILSGVIRQMYPGYMKENANADRETLLSLASAIHEQQPHLLKDGKTSFNRLCDPYSLIRILQSYVSYYVIRRYFEEVYGWQKWKSASGINQRGW